MKELNLRAEIKEMLESLDISNWKLAKEAKISQSSLKKYLNNEKDFFSETAVRIYNILKKEKHEREN